ncbi:MAG: hypothetical protein LM593_05665 [Candidatus Verstraetearchaeota archaeon]|jgi:hypothetical protein|nr:hypothetical protein [Candidatus Verstraetearchaeota archaeon]
MITWFDNIEIPEDDMKLIEEWIKNNIKEIHEIYHFIYNHEMEGSKIIHGKEIKDEKENTIIISYELYLLCNMILIIKSEEKQIKNSNRIVRNVVKLGILEIPTFNNCSCCSKNK